MEEEVLQLRKLAERGRHLAGQRVPVQAQQPDAGEIAQFGGNTARQLVVGQKQLLQLVEPAEFRRDRPPERVGLKADVPEVGEAPHFGRDVPTKGVELQAQVLEAGQSTDGGGNRSGDRVAAQGQCVQPGQVSEFRRHAPRQVVAIQRQLYDPPVAVYFDAPPVAEPRVGQPTTAARPVRSAKGPVQRFQDRAIVARRTLQPGALMRRNGIQPFRKPPVDGRTQAGVGVMELPQGDFGE